MICARPSPLLSLLVLAGCGYQSQYAPPGDGRARVLWHDDHLINNVPSLSRTDDCHRATWWLRHPGEQADDLRPRVTPIDWAPRYYGPDLVVLTPGIPPPRPVLFSPSLTLARATVAAVPSPSLDKDLAAVMLVIAVVVLPAVDVTFAALRPESDARSADAIDEANAYNDLARSPGTPCSQ